jgi:hypothetical protein
MPLFRRPQPADPPQPPARLTMDGGRQAIPEAGGRMPRRHRLFVECARRLADCEAVSPSALGRPLSDDFGLEELVSRIKPVFERDHSLIRWVALRGAVTELYIRFFEDEDADISAWKLQEAMGLEWRTGADGQSHPDLVEPWRSRMSARQRQDAIGIAASVLVRVQNYPRYSNLRMGEVNTDAIHHVRIGYSPRRDCLVSGRVPEARDRTTAVPTGT